MKKQVKYKLLTIPKKLSIDIKIWEDSSPNNRFRTGEFTNDRNGDIFTTVSLFPTVTVSLTKPGEMDENGQYQKSPYNINDNVGLTKYQLPIFIMELDRVNKALQIPELYSYINKRLTVNEELAEKHRRVFMSGNIMVELSPVVITGIDDVMVEGIKMKFNNEQSTVLLTLNEIEVILFSLKNLDVDSIALMLHLNYLNGNGAQMLNGTTEMSSNTMSNSIDIKPKAETHGEES